MSYAVASVICIGLNLTFQCLVVFFTKPLDKQMKEQAVVWTSTKIQTQEGDAVDTRSEMTGMRVVEMVTER